MSTIAKLDPRVRRERAERRDLRRSLGRVIGMLQLMKPPPLERLALSGITADHLHDITRNPRPTGATKQRLFADLIKLLEAPNDRSTTEPSAG